MITSTEILDGKILVVDDQELTARIVTEMLREAGYANVTVTTDPSAVQELHRVNRYDLILLDLQMPGMDGFRVMEALGAVEADGYLPVLAMTAEPALKLNALKSGAKDFISKPFDPDEALTRIYNMLEVRLLHEEARKNAKALETMALYDPLTGLANRRLLTDRISASLANARRGNSSMAIVFLDLDGFKQVNDTLGHGVGDALLRMVSARLTAAVRVEDTAGRLGGDEFVIALWHVDSIGDVTTVASKLINSVSMPYLIDGHTVSVTTSAGISIYPAHGSNATVLMMRADEALYAAKRAGRNAFRIAEPAAAREAA